MRFSPDLLALAWKDWPAALLDAPELGMAAMKMPQDGAVVVHSFGGVAPTSSEGTIHGRPYEFRARHGRWRLEIRDHNHRTVTMGGEGPTHGCMLQSDVHPILLRAAFLMDLGALHCL